jgi:hypothetical protein
MDSHTEDVPLFGPVNTVQAWYIHVQRNFKELYWYEK